MQVQNVSSPFHSLICGLVHISEFRFPELGVRFIAVNDGVDSEDQQGNDFTPFRNIINEWYTEQNGYSIKKFLYGMCAGIRI